VFDRPGRVIPAMGVEEHQRLIMVNWPYVEGKDGTPEPLPNWQPGQPVPQTVQGPPGPQGQPSPPMPVKFIDLKKGEYSIQAVAGKAYATRREEASDAISNVMKVVPPEMAAALAPAWLEEQDYPGAKKIAEIAKNSLPPQLQQAYQEDQEQPAIPPQIQAQMQAMQAQLQQATQIIQTDQIKQQATLEKAKIDAQAGIQKAEMDAQVRLRIAEMDAHAVADKDLALQVMKNAAAIAVAHIGAAAKGASLQAHAMEESQALGHEAMQADADRQHEAQMADQQHQQALAQREQEAALTPPEMPADA